MKDNGKIKGQFKIERQDDDVLNDMRPVMQEKARRYKSSNAKNKKSLLLSCCMMIVAVVITAACFTPALVAHAGNEPETHEPGWISEYEEIISFSQYFGESGERGVYYFEVDTVECATLSEKLSYDKRIADEKLYTQFFRDEKSKMVLRLFVSKTGHNAPLFFTGQWTEGKYKDINYYYVPVLGPIKGIAVTVSRGGYDYSFTYADTPESVNDISRIPEYLDLLFKLN